MLLVCLHIDLLKLKAYKPFENSDANLYSIMLVTTIFSFHTIHFTSSANNFLSMEMPKFVIW